MDPIRQLFESIGAQPVGDIQDPWGREVGLLAVGGVLEARSVLAAYRLGVFPWPLLGEEGPVFWCSPDPRFILLPDQLHISRSLEKVLRRKKFEIRFDHDFCGVIRQCALLERPGYEGTWITESMIDTYVDLERQGFAHSVESYLEGELVGGLYGVASGGVFFGESMFTTTNNASKVAFVHLVRRLEECGYRMIDCQQTTAHLARFGAREIERKRFLSLLEEGLSASVDPRCFEGRSQSSGSST